MNVNELGDLLRGPRDAVAEHRLVQQVVAMDAVELQSLVSGPGLAPLLERVDDHVIGPDNHRRLVEVLSIDRLRDLGVEARAALVHALQRGWTDSAEEEAVERVVRGTNGEELTRLKNRINAFNDRHDLESLLFVDVDDDERRGRIIQHLRDEAPSRTAGTKVLSDIDDTVFCRLHDERYPKGTLYPGVLAFQQALDRGPDDTEATGSDLTFVTARPSDVLGLVESHSRESLRKAGITDLSMLSGSVFTLATHDAMAGKKVDNINHWIALFPEYRMVFMGDSGQGDVVVGEKVFELHGEVMNAVFIHDVVDTPQDRRDDHANRRVFFHDTYVGAANTALELGLISGASRDLVAREAVDALDTIAWESSAQEEAVRALVGRDARGQ